MTVETPHYDSIPHQAAVSPSFRITGGEIQRDFTEWHLLAENGMPPEQIAATLLDSAAGGILYIHQADLLPQTEFGVAVFGELLTNIPTEESGETLVVLGGYPTGLPACWRRILR